MKSEKSLWSSVSILIGAVIAVLAFVRGGAQIWLLLGIFALWGAWVVGFLLMPMIKRAKKNQKRKAKLKSLYREGHGTSRQNNLPPAEGEGGIQLLMCHVNLRITGYIRSIYQNATWEWCEKNPEMLILNGGIGRIRVYGVDEYDHADVKLDKMGNISCSMVSLFLLKRLTEHMMEKKNYLPTSSPLILRFGTSCKQERSLKLPLRIFIPVATPL